MFEIPVNFNECRALLVDDGESVVSIITAQDAAKVTALAVEYEGEWPVVSGIRGSNITLNDLVTLGEKIRGTQLHRLSCHCTNVSQASHLLS
jgi:hypothetical protein